MTVCSGLCLGVTAAAAAILKDGFLKRAFLFFVTFVVFLREFVLFSLAEWTVV